MKALTEQGGGKRYAQLSRLRHTSEVTHTIETSWKLLQGEAYKLQRRKPITELSEALRASLFTYILLSFFFCFPEDLLKPWKNASPCSAVPQKI